MAKKAENDTTAPQTRMNIDDIKTIFELMKANDIAELDLELGDMRLKVTGKEVVGVTASLASQHGGAVNSGIQISGIPEIKTHDVADSIIKEAKTIRSPMVGTFYSRPNPEVPEFVKEGSQVTSDTVVCLIEAMKLFNEIKAETEGKILKVLVKDGSPVEYNQPLFEIE